ncbi:MAG: gamma-glutamyltransferase [Desulfobacterales bacterium]|nr:gamma-glutamyltransferase [Desulfobacterales bacterium]
MSKHSKAIVASGHDLVGEAAGQILREGGNAFDAVVAAGFASAVVEPTLTSLGGGGFLLGHSEKQGQDLFFDFFVNTPGLGRDISGMQPHFFPVTVHFSGKSQDFNVGRGSVAVPGNLKGLIHIQDRLGRMSLAEVLLPAREYAREHIINQQQGHFLQLLYSIMTLLPDGKELYEPGGRYLKHGNKMKNPACAMFLDELADDKGERFYNGDIAVKIDRDMREGNGLLSRQDLANYRVYERKPLKIPYRGHTLLTSPEPSMGGTLIGLSLSLMENLGSYHGSWGDGTHLARTVSLMQQVEEIRKKGVTTPDQLYAFLEDQQRFKTAINQMRLFSRGTTHVSISDRQGNCASMTCSNGEGSGYFAPGTGVMLNNMMGEDDLHPDGFHSSPAGIRVGSMMSPSLLLKEKEVRLVIGSGGSKRIRPAVSQVLSQVVDFDRDLQEAVNAPRLYWDGEIVQVEPGFSAKAVAELAQIVKINPWDHLDVYFGGVHAVIPGKSGAGDPRRGGSVIEV